MVQELIYNGDSNSKHGIYFYNVKNGKIDNVTVNNSEIGIYLESSNENQITNNSCIKNDDIGIKISNSNNNQ